MANYKYPNAKARKRAEVKRNKAYKRQSMTGFAFRFHNVNDVEVIAKLKSEPNKSGYVRKLIKDDLEKK